MAGKLGVLSLRNYLIGSGVALVGSVAFTYLPNTTGVKYARQYVEASCSYCKNLSAEPETMTLLNQVIQDINARQATPVKKAGIDFLQTNTLYPVPFHKGNSSTGSFIGFPIATRCNAEDVFYYHCPDSISLEMAKFCLLSEAAKKFLFAREVYYVEDNYVMFRCILGIAVVTIGCGVHYLLNSALTSLKEMKLHTKMMETSGKKKSKIVDDFRNILEIRAWRHSRLTFILVSVVFIQIYRLINNFYNYELERSADEKVAQLGPEYRKGGLEYYGKLVNAGKYIRLLGETDGLDINGNLIQGKYPVLFKHVPSTQRYMYFVKMAEKDEKVTNNNS